MALSNDLYCPAHTVSLLAAVDGSSNLPESCDCVILDATAGYVEKSTANAQAVGFVVWGESPAAAGDGVSVITGGIVRARASAGITLGDLVIAAADGEVASAATTGTAIQNVIGIALTTVSNANEYLSVLIAPMSYRPALT